MLFSILWYQKYMCFGTGTKSTLLRWHLYAQFWWQKYFTGTIPDKADMLFSIHWYQNWLLRSWRTYTAWANQIPPHHYFYVIIFLALNLSMLSHQLVSGVSESETFHARLSLHLLTAGPAQCERSAQSVSVSWCIPLCTRPHLIGEMPREVVIFVQISEWGLFLSSNKKRTISQLNQSKFNV